MRSTQIIIGAKPSATPLCLAHAMVLTARAFRMRGFDADARAVGATPSAPYPRFSAQDRGRSLFKEDK